MTYKTLTLENLMSGPTDIDWLINGIIPKKTTGLIAGDAGIGKTWLTCSLALSIATGKKWLGHFPVKQGSVLIVDEENSDSLLRKRFSMLLNAQKLSGENLPLHFIMNGGIDFYKKAAGKESTTAKLFALISDLEPELVIFDSLTRCHSGNENVSQDMATVFRNVKVLTKKTSVLFTHHLRKGNGLDYGNAGQRIRGSSDIRAFVDYTLLIDKAPSGAKITHDKSRWSEPIKPFSVAFDFTEDTFDLLYEGERTDSYHDVWIWLQEKLEDGTLWRQELVELAKSEQICSQRTLDTVLTWRTKEGFLIKTTHGKQKQYELAAYPVTIYSEDEALL